MISLLGLKLNKDLVFFCKTILFSRIIIVILIFLTLAINSLVNDAITGDCINNACRINILDLFNNFDHIVRGDVDWYKSVALEGYTKEEFDFNIQSIIEQRLWMSQKNWAFFPAWPFIWKYITFDTMNIYIGTLLANIFFIIGAFIMGLYIESIASCRVKYSFYLITAFYPFSYFFSLPLPESLFFFSSSIYIYSISKSFKSDSSFYITIISGIVCGLTKQLSLLLSLFALAEYFKLRNKNKINVKILSRLVIGSISPWIGLSIFMRIIFNATGNSFSFVHIQLAWRRFPEFPFSAFYNSIKPNNFGVIIDQLDNFLIANQIIFILCIISSTILLIKGIYSWRKSNISYDYLIISISLFLVLLSATSDSAMLISLNRIVGCNPIFIIALSLSIHPKIIKLSMPIQMILLGSFTTFSALGIKPFYY